MRVDLGLCCTGCILDVSVLGVANGTSKNVGLGKFWQDLEIAEAFLISLEVLFLHGLFLHFFESRNFCWKSFLLKLGFLTRISASLGFYHSPRLV